MSDFAKATLRILIALCISIVLSSFGLHGSIGVLQSMYTVLGIAFSIAMSLIVSFDLSKIYNIKTKQRIRNSIKRTRNSIIFDFSISTIILIISSTDKFKETVIFICNKISLNIVLCAICIIAISLLYEVYNFTKIQSLNEDITDRVMEEEMHQKKDNEK